MNIWLMGGLGNQLFQINYANYLKKRGIKVNIFNNLCFENFLTKNLGWTIHEYVLDQIIDDEIEKSCELIAPAIAKSNYFNQYSNFYKNKTIPKVPARNSFGYFQNPEFNENIYFNIKNELYDNENKHEIVAHLRFGDSPNIAKDILFQSKILKEKKFDEINIATNDKKAAKDFLYSIGITNFSYTRGSVVDDFKAMINSKNLILSSSTFSWWAAKLNKDIENIYIPTMLQQHLGNPKNQT